MDDELALDVADSVASYFLRDLRQETELVDTFVQLHKDVFKPTFEQKPNDEIIYKK